MVTLLKIGGNVLDSPQTLLFVLQAFAAFREPALLVHGGGKIASELMRKMGIEPVMVDGRRITDRATLDVVTMVYGGLINKQLVASLQAKGCNAIGLTGADANLIPATKRAVGAVDYGFVGDLIPSRIDAGRLKLLLDAGLTPVLAPLTHDEAGSMLNTNADTIASSVAVALSALCEVRLVYCFEKNGVLRNPADDSSVIPVMDELLFAELKASGAVSAGMIPKLENAFQALAAGVREVVICGPGAFRLEGAVPGTTIRKSGSV